MEFGDLAASLNNTPVSVHVGPTGVTVRPKEAWAIADRMAWNSMNFNEYHTRLFQER